MATTTEVGIGGTTNASTPMPRYQCHKKVWALQIKKINVIGGPDGGGAIIFPEELHFAPFEVSGDFMSKHQPVEGGYLVQYEDGYKSYSPASAFEDGYFRCSGHPFVQEQQGTHGPRRVMFDLQDGPIKEVGVNGVQIDHVIEWAKVVIEGFNKAFPCRENSVIITKLDEALLWSMKRKLDREKRNVEGLDKA